MPREVLQLESCRFTTISALAREVEALLESSDYKLEIVVGAKDFDELNVELEDRRTMGRVVVRVPKQKHNGRDQKKSLRYEVIDDTYKKWPDGRLEALNTRKGRDWYREQVQIMVIRQNYVCGLVEHNACLHPERLVLYEGAEEFRPTFEHWDKRGAGKRNDSVDPKTKNCAVHSICNGELGSRRIP